MTSDWEMLDQLMKLDELVRDADPRSIEWLTADFIDELLLTQVVTRNMIAFFEAERAQDNQGANQ